MLFLQKISLDDYKKFRVNSHNEQIESETPVLWNEQFQRNTPLAGEHFCFIWLYSGASGKQIIGTISFSHKSRETIKISKLREIRIVEAFQKQGYGHRIMKILLKEAQEYGSPFLSLFVFKRNVAAQSLYTKLGFTTWKEFNQGNSMIKFL
ncbi:MAG: GNAT family N-acetyltransferase [Candidatus Kariarchaeaceae archaeon]